MNLCLWLNQHNASSSNISRNLFRSSVFMKIFIQLAVHLPINWAKYIKLLAKRKPRIEIREMAKKAHVWTDEGFDENSRGSTNWIRKQLYTRRIHTRVRRIRDCGEVSCVSTRIGAYATARGHGGIFTCSNSARAVKLAVSLCLHYYVNHNVRQ